MMSSKNKKVQMPAFGDILNAGIQIIKQLGIKNQKGTSTQTFSKNLQSLTGITEKHLEISYLNIDVNLKDYDEDLLESCFYDLERLVITCLVSIGLIKNTNSPLRINTSENFLVLMAFNETVTPENLLRIDPWGKIFFWLMGTNFIDVIMYSSPRPEAYLADLDRFDRKSFRVLKRLNHRCYGKQGDPLINHLIEETVKRTSVFMNSYSNPDIIKTNIFIEADFNKILNKVNQLNPTQFEYLCLKVVEVSLKNEEPNAKLTCIHTGKTNDGGIDGKIIQQFNNGEMHTYYIQAKQYQSNVSNSNLRNFVGAYPPDKKFHHGIFMATSNYTKSAEDYAKQLDSHSLTLVNQFALFEMMMKYEVGLKKVKTEALAIDEVFFKNLRKK